MSNTVSESNVISEIKDQVKWIWFNRPEVRNALIPSSADAVREHIEKAAEEGARVIVLGGKGGAFCSGADLKAVTQMDEYSGVRDVLTNCYHPLVLAMAESPLPVIAAVDGAAAGIGCDISLAADMRLVSDRTGVICRHGIAAPAATPPARAWERSPTASRNCSCSMFRWNSIQQKVPMHIPPHAVIRSITTKHAER